MNTKQIMEQINKLCKQYDEKEEKKAKAKEEKDRRHRHHSSSSHRHHHRHSGFLTADAETHTDTTATEREPIVVSSEETTAAKKVDPATNLTITFKPDVVADKMVGKIIKNDTTKRDTVYAALPKQVSGVTVNVNIESVIDRVADKLLEKTDAASEEEVTNRMKDISMDDFINMMISSILEVIDDNGGVINDEVQVTEATAEAVEVNADDAAEGDNSAEGNEAAPAEAIAEAPQTETQANSNTAEAVA